MPARACRAPLASAIVVAIGALVPAPAMASGWMVGGSNLVGTRALATTAKVDEEGVLQGAGITVVCEGKTLNAVGPEIKSPNTAAASSIEFTECSAASPCRLTNERIKTEPVIAEATLEGALAYTAVIVPKAGTIFTSITFTGTECALEGTQPITGRVKVLAPTGQGERTVQLISSISTEASHEIKIGSGAGGLTMSVLRGTAHGERWSLL